MISFLLLCALAVVVTSPTLGYAAADPATAMAKSFYCDTFGFLSGNVGVIIGMTLTTFGVYTLMTSGPGFGVIFMIVAGIFFTTIPTIFEGSMNTIGQIFSGVSGHAPGAISTGC